MLFDRIQLERGRLLFLLSRKREEIRTLPTGTVFISKNAGTFSWFRYLQNGRSKYLGKKEEPLVIQLTARKYLSYQIEELEQEITLLDKLLKDLKHINYHSVSFMNNPSPYQQVLLTYLYHKQKEEEDWINASFHRCTNYPEKLIHSTLLGHPVRSKSEVIIANSLFTRKIPYRYECELNLAGVSIYPDFTIRHPKTQKIFYWEHFGMMSNHSYSEAAFNKLKLYAANNILPAQNLIMTFETQETPLSSEEVAYLIEKYFED